MTTTTPTSIRVHRGSAFRHFLFALIALCLLAGSRQAYADGVPVDGDTVPFFTGGAGGCPRIPSGLPLGAPAEVFHVPWPTSPGGMMDHTILVVYGPDGKTPVMFAEMMPDFPQAGGGKGGWAVYKPGAPPITVFEGEGGVRDFNYYQAKLQGGTLIPGGKGNISAPNTVGQNYGLLDNCCTMTAYDLLGDSATGCRTRKLNSVLYRATQCGAAPPVRWTQRNIASPLWNNVGSPAWQYGRAGYNAAGLELMTGRPQTAFSNGIFFVPAGADMFGRIGGSIGGEPGQYVGMGYGTAIGGDMALVSAGYNLGAYSPLYQTGRVVSMGGRLFTVTARGLVPYAGPATAAAGAVYLVSTANDYRCATNELCSMDNINATPDEFDAMIPYNICSSAYWQNVGSYYGLCDPLPPPTGSFGRRRPGGARPGGPRNLLAGGPVVCNAKDVYGVPGNRDPAYQGPQAVASAPTLSGGTAVVTASACSAAPGRSGGEGVAFVFAAAGIAVAARRRRSQVAA